MKKTVIVKKCKSHRVGIGVFLGLIVIAITIYVLYLRTVVVAALFYVPILLIVVPMTLYYSTWQIQFEEKEVVKRVFFRKVKNYSYVQIREVVKCYYVSERCTCICIYFTDGKMLRFRMDDENAVQAVKNCKNIAV